MDSDASSDATQEPSISPEIAKISSPHDIPESPLTPPHRLPTELLIEIFDLCTPLAVDAEEGLSDTTTPQEEVERVAKNYLLQLSQVCSRWHSVAMGTPMLWSTIIVDTTLWGSATVLARTLLSLVRSSLQRSGCHPLLIHVAFDANYPYVLAVLSHHSARWRYVRIWHEQTHFPFMDVIKGNLPLLERVEICHQTEDWTDSGLFKVAPRLTYVEIIGWAGALPVFPWNQLKKFKYRSIEPDDLADTLALLQRFSARTRCELSVSISDLVHADDLPPIVSNVAALNIDFTANLVEEDPINILGAVLDSLTLPCLTELGLTTTLEEPWIHWYQHQFLSFASRSALHASLTALDIGAIIHDVELLQCLAVLPLLEQLIVSDCQDELHAVLTDGLLRPLARTPDLVPRLNFFSMTSLLRFSDEAYWEFVNSRLIPDGANCFEIKTYWLPRRGRDLYPEFLARGSELEARKVLVFTAGPDPDYIHI
ncbi:hypothetical protein DFH09DRAFT_1164863 [Mycena vulgaris]|nr:hypothetical protein DFH09DRAFT_1164863 [Mycena vulgaris]